MFKFLAIAALLGIAAQPSIAAEQCYPATTQEGLGSAPYVQFTDKDAPIRFLNIAALAPISATQVFVGNFLEILLLDTETKEIGAVPIKGEKPKVQPAGLTYSPSRQLLFSADYLLNKVSVFRYDGASLEFLFDIGGMISPEGVTFDSATSILSVAEYDGSRVLGWKVDIDKREAKLLWERNVGQAHGITTMNGRVYASGLVDRKIYVFDQETGTQLDVFGSRGWDPNKLEFLWPTTVAPDGTGKLVVADAETGYVTILDPETKKITATIGGAGPGRGMFSQPYAATVANGKLTIISTKDERFVSIDYPSLCVAGSYVRDTKDWSGWEPSVPPLKADQGDYLYSAGPRIPLFNRSYIIYNSALVDTTKSTAVLVGSTMGPTGYVQYKQLQYVKDGPYEYLFSPYAYNGPNIIRRQGSRLYALNFPAHLGRNRMIKNCWADWGNIACAEAEGYDLPAMRRITDEWVAQVNGSRCGNGFVPASAMADSFKSVFTAIKMEPFDMSAIFASAGGKAFWEAYAAAQSCEADTSQLARVGAAILAKPDQASLYELSLISAILPSE
ncbi:NHL repeat-containing protein [Microvirga alba]|uniref:Uncharacterized protein n=1 Tax=Microvirga alba TaxID=2791025 RepID=A0A931FLI0_9HYPH|nr:hypothetical protein [Microvirga alba]MBF9232144.1 hypothetical protein [Microvirga alba]